MFMPRTIDKIRATFPGGHLGPYLIVPGLSGMLLDAIGIELPQLRRTVMLAKSDVEIAGWLREHAAGAPYAEVNRALSAFEHANVPPDQRAQFDSLYPAYLRARYARCFDLLEADDRELYPAIGTQASAS